MKKIFLVIGLFFTLFTYSGNSFFKNNRNDYSNLALEQFYQKKYALSYFNSEKWLDENKKESQGKEYKEQIMYINASSAWFINKIEASALLGDFINKYPKSVYKSSSYFMLGVCALEAEEYNDAEDLFNGVDMKKLSKQDVMSFEFYRASNFVFLKKFDKAKEIFGDLNQKQTPYVAAITYYESWMDYCDKKSKSAESGFEKIKDLPQYKDIIPYYMLHLKYIDGELDEVLEDIKKLLTSQFIDDLHRKELYRLIASVYFDKNEYLKSKSYYDKYISMQVKDFPEDYNKRFLKGDSYRLGLIYYTLSNYDKAEFYLKFVADNKSKIGQCAAYHLGLTYLRINKKDQAKMSFEQASLCDFDKEIKEKALYNYALICYETQFSAFNEQVKVFMRILEEFPHSQYSDEIYSYLSDVFLSSKDYQGALKIIEKVKNPDKKLLQTKAKLLVLHGVEQFNKKDFRGAIKSFTTSLELSKSLKSNQIEAYYWRGETYYSLKSYKASLRDMNSFLSFFASKQMNAYPSALYTTAYIYFNQKKYEEARDMYNKFISLKGIKNDIRYADAYNRIGDCFYAERNYIKAEDFFKKADIVTPGGNDYAVFRRAFSFGIRKQYKEKIDLLRSFKDRFKNSDYSDDALYEIGKAYVELHDSKNAIFYFNELMNLYPNSSLSRKAGIQIALQHYNSGEQKQAIDSYKKVISIYPGSSEAKTALGDLKSIYLNQNKVKEYVAYTDNLSGSVKLNVEEKDSLSYAAAEHILLGENPEKAIPALKAYLEEYPEGSFYVQANYHIGRLLAEENKIDQAIPYLEEVTINVGNKYRVETTVILADIYYKKENYKDAIDFYDLLSTISQNNEQKNEACLRKIYCYEKLKDNLSVIKEANSLISRTGVSKQILKNSKYYRAKAFYSENKLEQAKSDFFDLSRETKSKIGAESKYMYCEILNKTGSKVQAEKEIRSFMTMGTSYSYWLARAFILLSDIYIEKGDFFYAKQYLQSLKSNYDGKDEILPMIEKRLTIIKEKDAKIENKNIDKKDSLKEKSKVEETSVKEKK